MPNTKKMTRNKMRISTFSYFFITFVLDGLLRLSGLFVFELLQSTELSRQDAVVPFIISWVVSKIVASFSAVLNENKFSEHIIICGVLLCAAGAALCILATNITSLIVCWGLVFGSGYGLASPHLSIRLKDENEDITLSSILQMTSSLGATIMPFVFSILSSYYTLEGSFLIFCGIILNYLPLALAAANDIEISIPNIKWRVRKKSNQYFVSKHEEGKTVSVESFINSLEPDLILEINQRDKYQDEENNEYSMNIPVASIPSIGRKRSETRGNDLQGLDSRFFSQNKTPSRLISEIKKYEKDRNTFEENFIADDRMEKTEHNKNCDIINSDKSSDKNITSSEVTSDLNLKNKMLDKITEQELEETAYENNELEKDCCKDCQDNESNGLTSTCGLSVSEVLQNNDENNGLTSTSGLIESGMEHNVYECNGLTSTCRILENKNEQNFDENNGLTSTCGLSESEILRNNDENNGLSSTRKLLECEIQQNVYESNDLTSNFGLLESKIKQNIDETKVESSSSNTFPTCDQYNSSQMKNDERPKDKTDGKSDKGNETPLNDENAKSANSSVKSKPINSVQKENLLLSPNCLATKNAPLFIKIHVEEYTFTANDKHWAENFNNEKVKPIKDNHINKSKSVKLDIHDHKFLNNPKNSKKHFKCPKLCKSKLSDIYSISHSCDLCDKKICVGKIKQKEKICDNRINVQRIVKYLEITTSRVWLSILLMSVIFEINLVTLLLMFADLGSDVDNINSDYKWILVAFGLGGFIGKICCCKISRVIPEKYHAIGVVLFLLNGLSTAGILYSSNLNWLAGFYCILGALEGGITYIIPKFVCEYIDGNVQSSLLSVKNFFSGVAIMCIPYGIGLFRDDMGDYEFLLQILSCSSILCAFLAYFLPHLISNSQKEKSAFIGRKIENV